MFFQKYIFFVNIRYNCTVYSVKYVRLLNKKT